LPDIERALLRARRLAIGTCRQDGERQIIDARKLVAHTQAATCEAQDIVELPARVVHGEREQFDQPVIFVPAYPQVPVVVARIFHRDHGETLFNMYSDVRLLNMQKWPLIRGHFGRSYTSRRLKP